MCISIGSHNKICTFGITKLPKLPKLPTATENAPFGERRIFRVTFIEGVFQKNSKNSLRPLHPRRTALSERACSCQAFFAEYAVYLLRKREDEPSGEDCSSNCEKHNNIAERLQDCHYCCNRTRTSKKRRPHRNGADASSCTQFPL